MIHKNKILQPTDLQQNHIALEELLHLANFLDIISTEIKVPGIFDRNTPFTKYKILHYYV